MEALYKMKKPKTGQADRTMRAKLKDTASKSSRANLLDSKRRIPLSEVQSSNKVPEQEVVKKEKPAMSRAERLVEWKKQREEAKAKQREHDQKNPPFRPGGKRPTLKSAPVQSPAVVAKAAPPAAVKKSAPSTSSTATSSTSTQAKKTAKKASAGPSRSSARLAAKQPASTSVAQKSATATRKTTKAPEPAKPRTKIQQTAGSKKTVSAAKPSVNRGRSGVNDGKGAASTKAAARKLSTKTQENSNERRVTTRSVSSKASTNKSSVEVKRGSVSKTKTNRKTEAKKVEETDSNMSTDPPTTPKKNSYVPIHPSPLLQRQVAPVRRETVYLPQFVNEPAWIPQAQQSVNFTSSSSDPNFDEAFKSSFSPFRFTAVSQLQSDKFSPTPSQLPQHQQFVLELNSPIKLSYDISSSSSLSEKELADTELVASPPARKRRRSSRRCSRRLEAVAPLVVNVHSLEEASESKGEEICLTESQMEEGATTESEGVDIGYFRGLHTQVTEKFMHLCQEWEQKSNKLEEESTGDDSTFAEDVNVEDVLGQIRTTVCQAQLLMRKKLKQYISLVEEAQDPTVEKRANADDLQSFWDMVYFQVEDVQKKFDEIEKLERNGWKHKAPTPAKKRTKKATKAGAKKAVSSSASEEANERLQAARDKRQAQRNRLKEMKLAAKRAREQEAELVTEQQPTTGGENTAECQEDPLPITPSPKKSRLARTPKVSSSGRQRRRSQRLLARSVFSPIEPTRCENICVNNEVPIGCLISLS